MPEIIEIGHLLLKLW